VDAPFAEEVPAVKNGRVLLLEDDLEISEIVRDYLIEQGYAVVAVQNGEDGVRELLAGEFTMIFCDYMMPGLRGDALFRAVEKICPELCAGFIFMTGHQDDEVKRNFIRNVNALVLWKPFSLKSLLDSIALVEVRRSFARMHGGWPVHPGEARPFPAADEFLPAAERCSPGKVAGEKSAALHQPEALAVTGERAVAGAWARPWTLAVGGLGLFLAGAALLGLSYAGALSRATRAAHELAAHEAEWARVSTHLQETAPLRPRIERDLGMRARIVTDRARPRWTTALHAVTVAAGEGIQLLEVQGSAAADDPAAWTLRVRGSVDGPQSRREADSFRLALEDRLKRSEGKHPTSARFEKIGDEPGAPGAALNQPRTTFVLAARAGAVGAAPAAKRAKR
jgi:CheY-like chemotaxis protein